MIFRGFRTRFKFIRGSSSAGNTIRLLVLITLFGGVLWGFWHNSGQNMLMLNVKQRVIDDTGLISKEELNRIYDIMLICEKKHAIKIYFKASHVPIVSQDTEQGRIFLGVCPDQQQVVLLMPLMWRKLIGDDFIMHLRNDVLLPHFESNTWTIGIIETLELLEKRINQVVEEYQKN